MHAQERRSHYLNYLACRTATYKQRCYRFRAVARLMLYAGLIPGDTVYDLGAGHCDFDYYLRTVVKWRGRYVPVDCTIDDVDLEDWTPKHPASFIVAMELVEHLHDPLRLINLMPSWATKAAILTTPNPDAVNVLACDPTHVSEVPACLLTNRGWIVTEESFFGQQRDSLLGIKRGYGALYKELR